MDLIHDPADDAFARGLESWTWIGLDGKRPLFASRFGDAFLEEDSGCWYLSHLEGTLTKEWPDRATMAAALRTEDGQDHYLLGGLVRAARDAGLKLGPDEVFDFVQPPILGGAIAIENLKPMDFVVSLNMGGQLHDQVRGLKPGARVTGVELEKEPAQPGRRRLFGGRRR